MGHVAASGKGTFATLALACAGALLASGCGECECGEGTDACPVVCPAGYAAVDGRCVEEVAACEPACDPGMVCIKGACIVPPPCDPGCPSGFVCLDDLCVHEGAICDPRCGVGFTCLDNSCVPVPECQPACQPGFVCVGDSCVSASTVCNPSCPAGYVCTNTICVRETGACDPPCEAGQTCVYGTCVGDPVCEPPCDQGLTCVDGSCVEDDTCDPPCPAGLVCEDGSCTEVGASCDPECEPHQICIDGECVQEAYSCDPPCEEPLVCVDLKCIDESQSCFPPCPQGYSCIDKQCFEDSDHCEPACEPGFVCVDNECLDESSLCNPPCRSAYICVDNECVLHCDPECEEGFTCVEHICLDATNPHVSLPELDGPFADGPAVTAACLSCHSSYAVEIPQTSHWLWLGETPGMDGFQQGATVGKRTLIDNFFGAIRSNESYCSTCHMSYGWTDDTFDFDAMADMDCLVCHADTAYYERAEGKAGALTPETNLVLAAKTADSPTRGACGACHFYAGGADNAKTGNLGSWAVAPTAEADVHMGGEGASCVTCHAAMAHSFPGSGLHNPVEEHLLMCADAGCHPGPLVHPDDATLEDHTLHVACQTCHIPTYSRQLPTLTWWDWSKAGDLDREPISDPETGKPDYDPRLGELGWAWDVEPVLAWYDGTFTRMQAGDTYDATPVDLGSPHGELIVPSARLFPFKVMRGRQPADLTHARLAVTHLSGTAGGADPYWDTWDWDLALAEGMAAAGLPWSGEWGFVETFLYLEINHEVAPKEAARQCSDCHGGGIDFTLFGYTGDPANPGYTGPKHNNE